MPESLVQDGTVVPSLGLPLKHGTFTDKGMEGPEILGKLSRVKKFALGNTNMGKIGFGKMHFSGI